MLEYVKLVRDRDPYKVEVANSAEQDSRRKRAGRLPRRIAAAPMSIHGA